MAFSSRTEKKKTMEEKQILRIRGHHLCCFLTFAGLGYDAAFTANMRGVVQRLGAGEPFRVTIGADDICAPGGHKLCRLGTCESYNMTGRDKAVLQTLPAANLSDRPWLAGQIRSLSSELVWAFRRAFKYGAFAKSCAPCEWNPFCSHVASTGFQNVLLFPQRAAQRAAFCHEGETACLP